METYTMMRHFADSWGLLAMALFFVAVVLRLVFRPGARREADDAASIPFKDYAEKDD
jgi:cytochrome c oxidase cbb3-type subunit 4